MKNKLALYLLSLLVICTISACTSGGDDGGDEQGLDTNACDVLGLGTRSLSRIVDGTACSDLTRSPVVRLAFFDRAGNTGFCSGSMVTNTQVVTAAHCFLNNPVQVVMLTGDSVDSAVTIGAQSWTIHPGFGPDGDRAINDVAVVNLNRAVALPTLPILVTQPVKSGEIVSIFGYGKDENGDFDFDLLKSGEMLVENVSSTHISADFTAGEGSNTCQGDSGGPVVSTLPGRPAVAGVTSTGTRVDCQSGDTSFFANFNNDNIRSFLTGQLPGANFL